MFNKIYLIEIFIFATISRILTDVLQDNSENLLKKQSRNDESSYEKPRILFSRDRNRLIIMRSLRPYRYYSSLRNVKIKKVDLNRLQKTIESNSQITEIPRNELKIAVKNNEIKKNVSHEKRKHPQEMLKNRSRFIHQRNKNSTIFMIPVVRSAGTTQKKVLYKKRTNQLVSEIMKNYEVNELKNLRALSNAMDKIRRIFNNLRFKYIQMYNILKKANIIENNEKKLELLSRIKNLPSLRSSKLKLLNELKRFSQMANRLEKQNDTKIIKKLTKPPFTKVLTSKIFDEDERNSKTRFGNAPSFKEIDKSQLSDKNDNKNTIKNKISQNSTELTQSTKNENVSIKLLKKPFKNDEQKPINKWKNEKNDKISGNSTVIVKNHGKQNFTDKTDEHSNITKYEQLKNNQTEKSITKISKFTGKNDLLKISSIKKNETTINDSRKNLSIITNTFVKYCEKINCDFEDGTLCKYERKNNERKPPAKQRLSLSSWQNWRGQFRNRVTGIAHARVFSKTNERFAAVYVYPLQWASLSTELPKETENTIRFSGWEATNGIRLRICCDNANKCPIRTNFDVNKRSRRWKEYGIVCPSGTSKLLFICENKGKNQGACGLDNIRLLNEACE